MANKVRGQFATKALGMFGFAQTHGHNAQASGFNFLVRLLQLSKPFATENSTKMTQKR